MCARYHSVLDARRLQQFFRVNGLRDFTQKPEVFPGLSAPFIRRPPEYGAGDEAVPDREVLIGRFGLLPHWAKDEKLCKSTYNARSETVATKPAFVSADVKLTHCAEVKVTHLGDDGGFLAVDVDPGASSGDTCDGPQGRGDQGDCQAAWLLAQHRASVSA